MVKPLTEAEVNGAAYDQTPCSLKTKIILCSTPRSGSYLLCRAMIHHGIGIPHEYFNASNAREIAPRLGVGNIATPELEAAGAPRQSYIAALLERRTVNGVFSAKIQGGQFSQYFRWSLDDPLFDDAHYVSVFREDLLSQAISFHVSLLTGRWGPGEPAMTRTVSTPQFFDRAAIENRMDILADQDRAWRVALARKGITPLVLTYEQVAGDLPGTLRRIAAHAKADLPSFDFDYAEEPPIDFRNAGEPSKAEIRRWFLAQ